MLFRSVGLLQKPEVRAVDDEGNDIVYVLSSKSSEPIDVIFVGEYGGTSRKHDRNLPEIDIEIVR